MLEIIDGIIWIFIVVFLLLIPFSLVMMAWSDFTFWLKVFGTSFVLFCSFLFVGKITDGLIKAGGLNK